MTKILHVLKESDSAIAQEIIGLEAQNPEQEVSLLLIQEAVAKPPSLGDTFKTYVLKEDLEQRGFNSPLNPSQICINYQEMLDLIFRSDKIVTW